MGYKQEPLGNSYKKRDIPMGKTLIKNVPGKKMW